MIKVTITEDDNKFTEFEHYSPESLMKMFTNAMTILERKRLEPLTQDKLDVFLQAIEPKERILP